MEASLDAVSNYRGQMFSTPSIYGTNTLKKVSSRP